MLKHYNVLVVTVLHKNIDDGACHSENLIEPAIRHGEQCEIGCPESVNVLLKNRLLTSFHEKVPYKQAHTTRSLVGSLCFTEPLAHAA